MKDITKINRILLPIDFSDGSIQALFSVIELAKQHNAELIILYAYRLIKKKDNNKDVGELKASLELEANRKFNKIKETILTPANIKASFLCEIGFLYDRLTTTVKNEKIDCLVVSSTIEKTLKKDIKNAKHILKTNSDYKVLFLP